MFYQDIKDKVEERLAEKFAQRTALWDAVEDLASRFAQACGAPATAAGNSVTTRDHVYACEPDSITLLRKPESDYAPTNYVQNSLKFDFVMKFDFPSNWNATETLRLPLVVYQEGGYILYGYDGNWPYGERTHDIDGFIEDVKKAFLAKVNTLPK